ncbi:MAG: asparagine synthase (glutamine-hydrolyzing) [Parasphingorhabdus sp.]|jgi:asparagine synthase (glutamine-hydrolysing)
MCAIFGAFRRISFNLNKVADALYHRGPDGLGFFSHAPFRIGMCRLAILDREFGDQPFSTNRGQVQVVCNGEIYNWRAVRGELESRGHKFRSQNDCEILPAAWLEWGVGMLSRLNGMFAMAIYDGRANQLTLIRDRCGQKPLYYHRDKNGLVFASEIKGLLAGGVEATVNHQCIEAYLTLRYVPEPQTLFKDIQTLPAAHYLSVSATGETELHRWWDVPSTKTNFGLDRHQAIDKLDSLVSNSVNIALQSDEPVAAYLSAGVDSAVMVDAIHRAGADIQTISMGFRDASDEAAVAKTFATKLGLRHHTVYGEQADLLALPRVVRQMDRPVGDALIVAFDKMASTTRALGCKVVLGGDGIDEIFAGYSFQQTTRMAQKLGRYGQSISANILACMPTRLLDRVSNFPAMLGNSEKQKLIRYLRSFNRASAWWQSVALRTLFENHELGALFVDDISTQSNWSKRLQQQFDVDKSDLRFQFREWLQDWSLIRQEKNTMAHSIEYRSPFMDHNLVEFGMEMPINWKIKRGRGKLIWRQMAARRLPATISERPKQPFYYPLSNFHTNPTINEFVNDNLLSLEKRGYFHPSAISAILSKAKLSNGFLHSKQLMALLILELWHQEFIDTPSFNAVG